MMMWMKEEMAGLEVLRIDKFDIFYCMIIEYMTQLHLKYVIR